MATTRDHTEISTLFEKAGITLPSKGSTTAETKEAAAEQPPAAPAAMEAARN